MPAENVRTEERVESVLGTQIKTVPNDYRGLSRGVSKREGGGISSALGAPPSLAATPGRLPQMHLFTEAAEGHP